MAIENPTLGWIFAVLLLLFGLGGGTLTPLFLDSLNPTASVPLNTTWPGVDPVPLLPSEPSWHRIDPFICIWISMGFDSLILGTAVLLIRVCDPGRIGEREARFPKSILLLSGSAQAVAALLYQFSSSGSRTPPYLFGVLGYFYIPIAFSLRFLILRKRPTKRKLFCVAVITVAEFVSLIPSMFPNTESEAARRAEGGAPGIGRILWPLCMVSAAIPHAIWSIMLEKTVKCQTGYNRQQRDDTPPSRAHIQDSPDQTINYNSHPRLRREWNDPSQISTPDRSDDPYPDVDVVTLNERRLPTCYESSSADECDVKTLNIAYVMFWNFLGTFLTTLALFWIDLIPGFGLLPDIKLFGKQFVFNVECIFGATPECGFHQIFTAWGRMVCKTTCFVILGFLLRYGEGANFYAILSALRQPMRFVTFTLFDEQPFRWHPHATLSTWLSVASLTVMFPTVIMYSRSPDVSKVSAGIDKDLSENTVTEHSSLLHNADHVTRTNRSHYESTDN